jgi:Ni,Fe-hydrogenase I large subunit
MSRLVVGPFNRVEGDLEVSLDVEGGRVAAAYVNSPLFRGFEHLLLGRDPADALVIAPRVCGICSVAHSVAAAAALAQAMGLEPARNGRLAANLVLAVENLADHLSHFYLFFMPDFAREHYRGRPWFEEMARRFKAVEGSAHREVLPARAQFMHLLGHLAGKWPHTLAIQPGGSTRALEEGEPVRLLALLGAFRRFLEQTLFGDALESVAALESGAALVRWAGESGGGDLRRFLKVADELELDRLGRGEGRWMSYGAYPDGAGDWLLPRGLWEDGVAARLDLAAITEDISHSWMAGPDQPLPPDQGVTLPTEEKAGAYSWCKAPRLGGEIAETGALARQMVAGHPLIRDLAAASGGDVRSRVVARLLELALLVPQMERWVRALEPGAPFCHQGQMPAEATGVGTAEAARGALGHWLEVRRGRIHRYQIIAPTTWNFSPRDAAGRPGPLERALVGTPVEPNAAAPVAVQHVVRSFDPCMVCTVH